MMQVGDVVCLKGANKQMTVIESYGESCKVTWFDETGSCNTLYSIKKL